MSELLKINVNDHTEKKGGLTYLSWAWAWAEVLKIDPAATWNVIMHGPAGSESPCLWVGETALVMAEVTINGIARGCHLPVMDNRNNAVKNPDARKISDAIMRCMTKAIAMHGLGLYIYAGEDLPEGDEPTTPAPAPAPAKARTGVAQDVMAGYPPLSAEDALWYDELAANVSDLFAAKGIETAFNRLESECLEAEQKIILSSRLDSKIRSALKAEGAKRRATAPVAQAVS